MFYILVKHGKLLQSVPKDSFVSKESREGFFVVVVLFCFVLFLFLFLF